jgi:HSP20 family protein
MVRNAIVRRPASLLDDFFNDEFFLPSMPSQNHLDVYQEDKNYVVEVDLPGYKKDEIHISYDQDLLTIKAEHKEEKKEDNKRYVYRSRTCSSFTRQIRFNNIDSQTIDAKFDEGVLKVILPIRNAEIEVKKIEVK